MTTTRSATAWGSSSSSKSLETAEDETEDDDEEERKGESLERVQVSEQVGDLFPLQPLQQTFRHDRRPRESRAFDVVARLSGARISACVLACVGARGRADEPPVNWLTNAQLYSWLSVVRLLTWLPWSIDQQLRRDSGLGMVEYQVLAMLSESPRRIMRMSSLAERPRRSASCRSSRVVPPQVPTSVYGHSESSAASTHSVRTSQPAQSFRTAARSRR